MGSSYTPPVAAPLTLTSTLGVQLITAYDGTNKTTETVTSAGVVQRDANGSDPKHEFYINGTRYAFLTFQNWVMANGANIIITGAYAANQARYFGPDGASGLGFDAAGLASLVANGVSRVIATATGARLIGIPTSASGLVTGDVWANSNVLTIVP